jgi:YVTN family beta-propeller protein
VTFKKIYLFILPFFLSSLLCVSCEKWLIEDSAPLSSASAARLLLYVHSTSLTSSNIAFTISGIKLQTEDNRWINLMDSPVDVTSTGLVGRQILLKEAAVEPGQYKGLKLIISKASVMGRDGNVSLALPQPDGEVEIKSSIRLQRKATETVSLEWDTDKSIERGHIFQPAIGIETQIPAARELLLFISNSASNYISIIDRSIERVIGAITVGDRPMGMALNATQDRLYVVNSASRNISVVDVTRFYVLYTIYLTTGIGPVDMVMIPDDNNLVEGKLYITNRLSNDVTVVNTVGKLVLKSIAVGTSPSGIAADPVRKEVYVTNERSNNLSIINARNDTLIDNITVDNRPTGIVVGKDKIYVFSEGSNRINIISPSLRKVVATIAIEGPPKRGAQGFSSRLFVANTSANTITFFNSQDIATRTIPVGTMPIGIVGDEKRNRLYVTNYGGNTISLIDPIGEKVLKELFVGKSPYGALLLER